MDQIGHLFVNKDVKKRGNTNCTIVDCEGLKGWLLELCWEQRTRTRNTTQKADWTE